MRRYQALLAVVIAAFGLVLVGGRLTLPRTLAKTQAPPQGLALKIAGAWLYHLYVGDSTEPTTMVGTLNADGSGLVSGSPMPSGATVSTGHCTWKFAGRNRLVGMFQSLGYFPDGTYGWYEKGPFDYTLSEDGTQLEGTVLIGNYAPDQEYMVDEPAYGFVPCTVMAWKIEAE